MGNRDVFPILQDRADQPDPGVLRQRQDDQERQLLQVRKVHQDLLQPAGEVGGRVHRLLPAGEVKVCNFLFFEKISKM